MLKHRLIPKLQLKTSRVGKAGPAVLVTTINFDRVVEIGDPVSQARVYQAQAADELIFLDLDASYEDRANLIDVVRSAARELFMPFTVGGGVRTTQDFRLLLENGADKVAVNTAALETPDLISDASRIFGAQCVVVSIDYREDGKGAWKVWRRGGQEPTAWDLVAWAREVERLGAGEILITSIDRDGRRTGLAVDATLAVTRAVNIPVITAGGCGMARHFSDGMLLGGANAVAAGTFFCFKDENLLQTRAQISNTGIPIRLHV